MTPPGRDARPVPRGPVGPAGPRHERPAADDVRCRLAGSGRSRHALFAAHRLRSGPAPPRGWAGSRRERLAICEPDRQATPRRRRSKTTEPLTTGPRPQGLARTFGRMPWLTRCSPPSRRIVPSRHRHWAAVARKRHERLSRTNIHRRRRRAILHPMPMPMDSNFLVPNATFLVVCVAILLLLIVGGLLLGGLIWLLSSRRRTTADS
jgi:hypothetical protein